jgi:hypothetical protein
MRRRHLGIAIVALLMSFTARAADTTMSAPPGGAAQVGSPPGVAGEFVPTPQGRILNGHVFMPSADVPGALVTTSFATYLVLGLGSTTANLTIGNRTFSGDVTYAGVGAVLGFEYAFLKYFSARLAIDDIIYSGTNGNSVFAVGSQLRVGFTGGVTASLPVGDSMRLAVLLDASSRPGLALTLGAGIKNIVNNCQGQPVTSCNIETGTIFSTQNSTSIQPALAMSWAPMRPLGVTANVAYIHVSQDQNVGSVTGDAMSLGLASDFDFKAISTVPIGLMLQFSWTAPISGTALQHVTDLGGGIFYTGRQNLALGFQLVNRRFAVEPSVTVNWNTWISTIGLRYYW